MKTLRYVTTLILLGALCAGVAGCNEKAPTETDKSTKGLVYTLIDGKSEYRLTGIGTASDATEIAIASTYNGKPVTEIGANAFKNNNKLTKIDIPSGIKTISNSAFEGCTGLTEITLPASVTVLGETVFAECTALAEIIVSASNTAYQAIDGNLYTKDGSVLIQYALGDSATSYTTPETVKTIADSACKKANNLQTVAVGKNVETVGAHAFSACAKINTLTLGNAVKEIGSSAFANCSALSSIVIPSSVTTMHDNIFYDSANLYGTLDIEIYCEAESKPSGWKSAWNYSFPTALEVVWGYVEDTEEE